MDAAITDQRIVAADAYANDLKVTVQNRGTSTLINTMVEISTVLGSRKLNATTIQPGASHTFSMRVPLSSLRRGESFAIRSRIILGNHGTDLTPRNNERIDEMVIP